ncbi:MAG: gamma-glutamyl-gamma-aminobutyrate hydrolase family protein [Atopobiaceae bacterium]|jgi:putative glutamine amidotransferase
MAEESKSDSCRPLVLVSPRWMKRTSNKTLADELAPIEGAAADFYGALIMAGASPILAPMTDDESVLAPYIALCSGLALSGGQDINPRLWKDTRPYDQSLVCDRRDTLELALIDAFVAADKPIFATCRGFQLLNVFFGGSLSMTAEKRVPRSGSTLWRHTNILSDPAHPVEVKEGSLLSRCVGGTPIIQTNSAHHCCLDRMGRGLVLSAEATDGMPEAIELPGARFVLGVQWHPECTWQRIKTDELLWHSFVDACR